MLGVRRRIDALIVRQWAPEEAGLVVTPPIQFEQVQAPTMVAIVLSPRARHRAGSFG
jgi:hypothetical protein